MESREQVHFQHLNPKLLAAAKPSANFEGKGKHRSGCFGVSGKHGPFQMAFTKAIAADSSMQKSVLRVRPFYSVTLFRGRCSKAERTTADELKL